MPRRITAECVCKGSAAVDVQHKRHTNESHSNGVLQHLLALQVQRSRQRCASAGGAGAGSAFDRHAHLVQCRDSVVICVFERGSGVVSQRKS